MTRHEQSTPDIEPEIRIFFHGVVECVMSFKTTDCLFDVSDRLNLSNVRYVSKGSLLIPSFSLGFQGIQDGDEMYVIHRAPDITVDNEDVRNRDKKTNNDMLSKLREKFDRGWAHKFKDPESVFKQLKDASNPITASESARISDLFRIRVETNPSAFRKVCARFYKLDLEENIPERVFPTVMPIQKNSPSISVLPVNLSSKSPLASSSKTD